VAHPFAHMRLRKGTRTTELAHLVDGESAGRKRLQVVSEQILGLSRLC
jgi:hypothetical protein